MGERNGIHAKVRSEEFLDRLENPFLPSRSRHGAVCHFPIEVFFRRSLERPLTHLGWCALLLLSSVAVSRSFPAFLRTATLVPECSRINWYRFLVPVTCFCEFANRNSLILIWLPP